MKTFKEWEENFPNLELSQYLQPMDEVDEELYLHAGEIAPPAFCFVGFVQMCDAEASPGYLICVQNMNYSEIANIH